MDNDKFQPTSSEGTIQLSGKVPIYYDINDVFTLFSQGYSKQVFIDPITQADTVPVQATTIQGRLREAPRILLRETVPQLAKFIVIASIDKTYQEPLLSTQPILSGYIRKMKDENHHDTIPQQLVYIT